jgi:mRNA interferase RelE/StbE
MPTRKKRAVKKAAARAQPNRPLRLKFHKQALKEYAGLEKTARSSFRKKLTKLVKREELPSPKNALRGFDRPGCYKIKLKKSGLRLVYHYDGENLVILVIAVGKRQRNVVYEVAQARIKGRL